ncbi:cytochrome c oxidase assembly protein [Rhizobium sp. P32RR-XVIII]|uniref:cytochrome c oxidase assembly protein n=1 Tax=Rhizobium sp. P32RR-XVIII TaxID=2726738 RepID=UPI00145687A6|nr:cytochrome c oxidase assembly protein [Rhizobium sp. P32RR-XVIII]NLS06385.1 cytochrome c oxidase assembly protein [Rhizobium sp. P32RR-XVIII]
MPTLIVLSILLFSAAPQAAAHGTEVHAGNLAWSFDPFVVYLLAVAGTLYVMGSWKLWQRSSAVHLSMAWRGIGFAAGWFTLAMALVSPLHWLGEHLFTFHMIEHEIIMAVSAPLFVLARPAAVFLWGLPNGIRRWIGGKMGTSPARAIWTGLTGGTVATILHGVAIWGWHAPALFDATVTNVALHRLQHLSFFVTAVLFWWAIRWRSDFGVAAWHVFLTMLHTALLGALIALSPHVLYHAQTQAAGDWGLTPPEDQVLAGMVMWIPAGTIYAAAALGLIASWILNSSRARWT